MEFLERKLARGTYRILTHRVVRLRVALRRIVFCHARDINCHELVERIFCFNQFGRANELN